MNGEQITRINSNYAINARGQLNAANTLPRQTMKTNNANQSIDEFLQHFWVFSQFPFQSVLVFLVDASTSHVNQSV